MNIDNILSLASEFEYLATSNMVKNAKESKKDPKAAVRSRGKCVFPAEHPKVTDDADHYPVNTVAQARNALARANQMSKAPEWYKGSLESFLKTVVSAVKKHYPSIEISEAAKKPGKG